MKKNGTKNAVKLATVTADKMKRNDNPYKPGSVSAMLFDALKSPADPRKVCEQIAKKAGKGAEQVWQCFEVLRTPKHSSNHKRSKAVAGSMEGTVQLVAI